MAGVFFNLLLEWREEMGEIKSSLELALERTKGLKITEKEREEIKRKEILQKAEAFAHRYQEGSMSIKEIQKEMERMEKKRATELEEYLVNLWMKNLSLNFEDEKLIDGIEELKNRSMDEIRKEFRNLLTSYQEEKEKARQKIRTIILEGLKEEGFDGSAIEPRIEISAHWQEENFKIDQFYQERLEKLKSRLRDQAIGKDSNSVE